MKLQMKILLLCIKKYFKWFIVQLFLSSAYLFLIRYIRVINCNDLMIALGGFSLDSASFLQILTMIFHCTLTIYFSYIFYQYEVFEKVCNVMLRVGARKWFLTKISVQLAFIFLFRLFYSLLIIGLFNFNIFDFIYMIFDIIVVHLLIGIVLDFLLNCLVPKTLMIFIMVVVCVFEIIFFKCSFFYNVIFGIILLIFQFVTFTFKGKLE